MNAPPCSHCQLPVGRLGRRREVLGEAHWFCCYGCCLAYQVHHGAREEPEAAAVLIRLGVGAFLAMNIMLFSLLAYSGALAGEAWLARLAPWLLWALATPLLVILGGPFLGGAWQAARQGRLSADALVCLGALSAYGYSAWQVLRGSDLVYFDTATMVLMLFTLGRYLEAQGRAQAARSLAPMLAAERAEVHLVGHGGAAWTGAGAGVLRPVGVVQPGDVLRVLPGERVAVDGIVIEGRSACDEAILTGQPQPRPKAPGAPVHAGSINGTGLLLVHATVAGSQTRWVRLSRLVREALAAKSLLGETVDRVAAAFIPGVLLLSAATVWFWSSRAGFEAAWLSGLAVLVVACPCSLGLAAPLAAALGIARAAQRGILVRGGGVLEALARVRAVAFDKTGTLTRGELQPVAIAVDGAGEEEVLRRAGALAAGSAHPAARAVLELVRARGLMPAPARDLRAHPGAGLTGTVDGAPCALGSAAFMAALGWRLPAGWDRSAPAGATRVCVGWAGAVRGLLALADALRPEAGPAVAALDERGLRTLLLSGDGEAAVAPVAAALGIRTWRAQLLPEDKVAALRRWARRHGPVAMVGDGLNDGPVLAAAAVGIAVGGASDLARESADVVLPEAGLASLPWLMDMAWAVRRSIRANLAWALAYNAVALALAAAGLLQPVLAAALMAGSSLVVVARTLRAGRAARSDGAWPRPAPAAVQEVAP